MPTSTTARLPCALCAIPADLHCPSDAATLCFRCDAKVHAANFIVARHSRVLLCAECSAPTPWSASGARLTAAGALCGRCEEEGEGEREREGEEQVVPWKDGMGTPPPGEGEGESGEEEEAKEGRRRGEEEGRKRRRRGEEEDDQEDFPSVSCLQHMSHAEPSLAEAATDEARATNNVLQPTKDNRRAVNKFHLEEDSRNNISQCTFTLSGSGTPPI